MPFAKENPQLMISFSRSPLKALTHVIQQRVVAQLEVSLEEMIRETF